MKCPKCGHLNRTGAKFCLGCGTPLIVPSQQATKSFKGWPAIGLAAIVVIAVGLMALILRPGSSGEQPTPASGTDGPPPGPSATPDDRLFWDDFEAGIKPDWNMQGDNFNPVDGRLVSVGSLEGRVGDYTWANYRVVLTGWSFSRMTLKFRVQDEKNYMEMSCSDRTCYWNKVSNGTPKQVPRVSHYLPRWPSIEVDGNTYRVVNLETGDTIVTFVDDTVSFGGGNSHRLQHRIGRV